MELVRWVRLQWDRASGVAAMVVGVLMLLVGWIEVGATEFVAEQIPFVVSAGLGGIVAVMLGGTLWLSADLRDEWRALDRIAERLDADDDLLDDLALRLQAVEDAGGQRPHRRNGSVETTRRRPPVREP